MLNNLKSTLKSYLFLLRPYWLCWSSGVDPSWAPLSILAYILPLEEDIASPILAITAARFF